MRFIYLITLLFCLGCKNSAEKEIEIQPEFIENAVADSILVWNIDAEARNMVRDTTVPDSIISVQRILNGLNEKYPKVPVRLIKQSADTVYTVVPDASFLGEQMGSAGAATWFADAVINLTSVPGINYVSFLMDPHSHAQSSIISGKEYEKWQRK